MEKKRAEIISRIIEFSRSDSISKDKRLPPERELAKILGEAALTSVDRIFVKFSDRFENS